MSLLDYDFIVWRKSAKDSWLFPQAWLTLVSSPWENHPNGLLRVVDPHGDRKIGFYIDVRDCEGLTGPQLLGSETISFPAALATPRKANWVPESAGSGKQCVGAHTSAGHVSLPLDLKED